MKKIELLAETNEHNADFLQGMINRMDMSYMKYGRFRVNSEGEYTPAFVNGFKKSLQKFLDEWDGKFPTTSANGNTIVFALRRLLAYVSGKGGDSAGNTEYLMDAANALMMEFDSPQMPEAYFKATDEKGSTGFAGLSEKEAETFRASA